MASKQPRRSARPASLKPEPKAAPVVDKVIETAMKRWTRADAADQENRDRAYADLEFIEVEGAQWTQEDGKVDLVTINQPQGIADEGVAEVVQNDVTVGAYDVAMEMGASYTTRREAALEGMITLVQAAPDVAPLVLDLLAQAQDWPLADKIAKRIKTMLPPQIQAEEARESGEPPPPPMPPSPQEQAAMQAQQRQEQLAAAQHELEGAKLQVEQQKLQAEMAKIQGELQRAAMEHEARMAEAARPAEGAAGAPAEDPRVDAIANTLQSLTELVSMLMEEMASPAEAPMPDAGGQDGPPTGEMPMPGGMPAEMTGAPQSPSDNV